MTETNTKESLKKVRFRRVCRCLQAVACRRDMSGTRETLLTPEEGTACRSNSGRLDQREEGEPMVIRESDQPIVLRDGRADHMGKGLTGVRSLKRKPVPDM